MLRADILTIFPEMLKSAFNESILRIAQDKGQLEVHFHNIRSYSENKHDKVDDRPFGGGPGMVMCCQPVIDAVNAVRDLDSRSARLIFMGPDGKKFNQQAAKEFSECQRLILVCGRYEGFDQRIFDILQPEIYSIGDYVLSGGELAAAVMIDAATRLIPGVLGHDASAEEESFSLKNESGTLLDYPHYTQPADYHGHTVPEVLRSGNHKVINEWRMEEAAKRTATRRPDLLK